MTLKQIFTAFVLILFTAQSFAQSEFDTYMKEGVQFHDQGEFDKAIESYKKALKLDPKSAVVNYEMALSYFNKGDYQNSIKHSDVVLKKNEDLMLQAYLTKGSALDMIGKTGESIKLFEKALKKTGPHYLLYYNLGLNYFKINDLDNAEENAIQAIDVNPNHATSHLMLANIHYQRGNTVQTLLAAHYFLFLEPDSRRSEGAYQMLMETFGANVSKDENKPNTINITLSMNDDNEFGAAELMVSMLEASKSLESNEGKTEDEMFVENTDKFFSVLGELKKKKNKGIWWDFYTTFFYDLAKSEHIETYCKYVSQIGNENSRKWLSVNEAKLMAFDNWLQNR